MKNLEKKIFLVLIQDRSFAFKKRILAFLVTFT